MIREHRASQEAHQSGRVHRTLMLTPWYLPHKVVTWKDAVTMLFLGKVEVIVSYDEELRSPSITLKTPAVVRLKDGAGRNKLGHRREGVKFSRINVYLRDEFTCQYCRVKFPMAKLTYDHVVPRAQGGRTVWENIVTACYECNSKKGNRTPHAAKMPLNKEPRRPKSLPHHPLMLDIKTVPSEWQDFFQVGVVGSA